MSAENKNDRTLLTLLVTDADKVLLETLSARDGDVGMSAVVRKLIRSEAQRVGIAPSHEMRQEAAA
jgi:hypothetical protein